MKEQLATLQDSEKGHTEALQLLQRQLTETKVHLLHKTETRITHKEYVFSFAELDSHYLLPCGCN